MMSTMAPTTMITQASTPIEDATSWSLMKPARLLSDTFAQIPTASRPQPISYTSIHTVQSCKLKTCLEHTLQQRNEDFK